MVQGADPVGVGEVVLDTQGELEAEEGVLDDVEEEHEKDDYVDRTGPLLSLGQDHGGQDQVGHQTQGHDQAEKSDPDEA